VFNIIKAEILKVRKRLMQWILFAILLAFLTIVIFGMYGVVHSVAPKGMEFPLPLDFLHFPKVISFAMAAVGSSGLAGLFIIILTASSLGTEYNWGTLRTVLSRGVMKEQFILAKVVTMLLVLALWLLAATVVASLWGMVIIAMDKATLDLSISAGGIWEFIKLFAITLYATLPYMLMALFWTVLGRSTTVGIAVTLLYTLIVENIIAGAMKLLGGVFEKLAPYTLNISSKTLLSSQGAVSSPQNMQQMLFPIEAWQAALAVLGYSALFLGLSLWIFKKRDIKFA
jgi:ABC-type transport system involved in multi-copper enzyme maturation permease subunit